MEPRERTVAILGASDDPERYSYKTLKPVRVILNPGTESPTLKGAFSSQGIPYFEACSLVLLTTGRF
jgi:hypothetical protein